MTLLDELREYAAEIGRIDWFPFSSMLIVVGQVTGSTDKAELLRLAVEAAAQLVREGDIVPGSLTSGEGFVPWSGDPESSADRLEREVADLIRDGVYPDLGDVCWFDVPEHAGPG